MVIVTHDMHLAADVADHVIFLHQGRIEEEGRTRTHLFGNGRRPNGCSSFLSHSAPGLSRAQADPAGCAASTGTPHQGGRGRTACRERRREPASEGYPVSDSRIGRRAATASGAVKQPPARRMKRASSRNRPATCAPVTAGRAARCGLAQCLEQPAPVAPRRDTRHRWPALPCNPLQNHRRLAPCRPGHLQSGAPNQKTKASDRRESS